jgi:diguanylate cyclase (GGDEF)-like protein
MSKKPRSKILCVDDEPAILQALSRLLKDRFEVLIAESAASALAQIGEHPDVAIVLSDFRMPHKNGVELLHEVRQIAPNAVRAILSGQIDLQSVSDALNDGDLHKFFLKPWENDYLLLQISEAVLLHQTLSEKARFQQLSITDPVTQLTNHRFFQDTLRAEVEKAAAQKKKLSLLMFDVDHFKAFNDRFGHPEGDRLLFAVAYHLEQIVGRRGFVSRYGGEEFTVLLPDYDAKEAAKLAEQVRTHFEKTPFAGLSSGPAYVTLSAGLSTFPDNGSTAAEVVESADRALYTAKRQGRNQVAMASNR